MWLRKHYSCNCFRVCYVTVYVRLSVHLLKQFPPPGDHAYVYAGIPPPAVGCAAVRSSVVITDPSLKNSSNLGRLGYNAGSCNCTIFASVIVTMYVFALKPEAEDPDPLTDSMHKYNLVYRHRHLLKQFHLLLLTVMSVDDGVAVNADSFLYLYLLFQYNHLHLWLQPAIGPPARLLCDESVLLQATG